MGKNNFLDTRWFQRLDSFSDALTGLIEAEKIFKERELSKLEQQGVIKGFEFTFELSWNVLKDFFESKGVMNLIGSKDTFKTAFNRGLIQDGQLWMNMVVSRNLTSHTYNEQTAKKILHEIFTRYLSAFSTLHDALIKLKESEV